MTSVHCVRCNRFYSSLYCATSLSLLKAMLFDRITGNSCVSMPQTAAAAAEVRKEIMLPLCDSGARSAEPSVEHASNVIPKQDGTSMPLRDAYDVHTTHWVCATCMALYYTASPPPLTTREYAALVPSDGAKTTTTATTTAAKTTTEEASALDMKDARHASAPSVAAPGQDCCPVCSMPVSPVGITMFLVILESQNHDYTRMRQCWLNECTRNVRLRKLIRDLQHYMLFDEATRATRLRLDRTAHAYRVHVEREVALPPHQRRDDQPASEQIDTIRCTAVRPRTRDQLQVHDVSPTIVVSSRRNGNGSGGSGGGGGTVEPRHYTGNLAQDHGLREPRERWLFEALGLHNDFDEATMPISAQALTRAEQRALRRALREM